MFKYIIYFPWPRGVRRRKFCERGVKISREETDGEEQPEQMKRHQAEIKSDLSEIMKNTRKLTLQRGTERASGTECHQRKQNE